MAKKRLRMALLSFLVSQFFGTCVFAQTTGQELDSTQRAQQSSATVTAAASGEAVRFTAPGNTTHIRLEVFSSAGERVFDSGNRDGNVFDWHWQNEKALELNTDSYVCVVTVRSLSGKTTRKLANLSFANKQTTLKPVAVTHLNPAQLQALGSLETDTPLTIIDGDQSIAATVIAHDGNDGQITRTRGAFTFRLGDFFSRNAKEQMRLTEEGNLGIGTTKPKARLDVAGMIRAREGFLFSDGSSLNMSDKGALTLTRSNGDVVPNVGGTGTQGRLAKWTDSAGNLGDSVAIDTGTGLQLTAAPSSSVDTNVIFMTGNDRTAGIIASSIASFSSVNGPFFALRGNTYNAIPGQRGLFAMSAGNVSSPTGREGSMLFNTGADQIRMLIDPTGNVGINTTTPTERLHVTGNGLFTGNLTVNGTLNATLPGGSGNYIQNNPSQQQTSSNFNISGNGTLGGTLSANVLTTPTITSPGSFLSIGGTSSDVLTINRSVDTSSQFRANSGIQTTSIDSFSLGGPNPAGPLSIGTTRATKITIGGTGLSSDSNAIDIRGSTTVSGGPLTTTGGVLTSQIGAFFTPLSIGTNSTTAVDILKPTTVSGLLTANGGISTNTQTISGDLTVGGAINGTVSNANNAANLGGVAASQYVQTTDPRMTDARSPTAGSSNYIQNTTSAQPADFNISGSGRVGNGLEVTSNFGTANLRVSGPGSFDPQISLAFNGQDQWTIAANQPQYFHIFNNPLSRHAFSIDGSNNYVGIGTDIPNAPFHVGLGTGNILFGTGGCGAGFAGLGFAGSLTCQNYSLLGNGSDTIINRATGGSIAFRENNQDQMRIAPGGKISITTLGSAGSNHLCINVDNEISSCSSSLRYKTNVNAFSSGLSLVKRLAPITFDWKQGGMKDLGLGAEDVEKIEPLLVNYNSKGEVEGVKYDRVGVVLINAVKEQQSQIEDQKTLIQSQQKLLETQQRQIEQQQRQVDALKRLVCSMKASATICKDVQ